MAIDDLGSCGDDDDMEVIVLMILLMMMDVILMVLVVGSDGCSMMIASPRIQISHCLWLG